MHFLCDTSEKCEILLYRCMTIVANMHASVGRMLRDHMSCTKFDEQRRAVSDRHAPSTCAKLYARGREGGGQASVVSLVSRRPPKVDPPSEYR